MSTANISWGDEVSSFVFVVFVQCTSVLVVAVLASFAFRRRAAVRQTVLRAGMSCALFCPLLTAGLQFAGLTYNPTVLFSTGDQLAEPRSGTPLTTELVYVPTLDQAPNSEDLFLADIAAPAHFDGPRRVAIVMLVWSSGFLLLGFGMVRSCVMSSRIVANGTPAQNETVSDALAAAVAKAGLSRIPAVIYSTEVNSPVVAGIWRPCVVLPSGFCQRVSSAELQMVLLHEVAHLVQRDHLSLMVERFFVALFWFHPLAYLLVSQLTRAREEVCDNYVLNCVDRVSYGETLLKLTRLLTPSSALAGEVGLFSSRWKLEERVSGLLDERRRIMVRTNLSTRAAVGLLVVAVVLPIGAANSSAETSPSENGKSGGDDLTPAPTVDTLPVAEVIARVNNEAITIDELAEEVLRRYGDASLQQLVDRKILEQACEEAGISVSEVEVEAEIVRIAENFGLTAEGLCRMIERERGLAAEVYRRDVVWPTLAIAQLAGKDSATAYFSKLQASAEVETFRSLQDLITWRNRLTTARAEQESRQRIATVNIGRIMQEVPELKRRTQKITQELQQAQARLAATMQELQLLSKALAALDASDAQLRDDLKEVIAKRQIAHQQTVSEFRQRAIERESEAYHSAYRLIYEEIRRYSREKKLDLVLRDPGQVKSRSILDSIDPARTDPKDSKAVLQQINQHVLYIKGVEEDDRIDITDAILERLRERLPEGR